MPAAGKEESILNRLTDKALLLLYSLGSCLLIQPDPVYVGFFFLAVTFSAFSEIWRKDIFLLPGLAVYGLITLAFPQGVFFYPLLVYDYFSAELFSSRKLWSLVPLGILFYFPASGYSSFVIYYLLMGMFLGGLLWYRSASYEKLSLDYKKVRDDGIERSLLLKEKNKTLIEKQNYEIYAATLKERNRIAREIHDHVGHMLSRAILMTGAMKTMFREPAAAQPLSQLEDTLNTAMDNIRESVHDLHDEAVNLKETVENLIASFHYCPVSLEYDIGTPPPPKVRYCFIAILKEGLSNISLHSQGDKAWVTLREHPAMYQLIIRDNGIGKDSSPGRGIGLSNMQERVEALKGSIHFESTKGFQIFVTIPKEKQEFTYESFDRR